MGRLRKRARSSGQILDRLACRMWKSPPSDTGSKWLFAFQWVASSDTEWYCAGWRCHLTDVEEDPAPVAVEAGESTPAVLVAFVEQEELLDAAPSSACADQHKGEPISFTGELRPARPTSDRGRPGQSRDDPRLLRDGPRRVEAARRATGRVRRAPSSQRSLARSWSGSRSR